MPGNNNIMEYFVLLTFFVILYVIRFRMRIVTTKKRESYNIISDYSRVSVTLDLILDFLGTLGEKTIMEN